MATQLFAEPAAAIDAASPTDTRKNA